MSSLYSSPFDEALSKPLIAEDSQQSDNNNARGSGSGKKSSVRLNRVNPNLAPASYSTKLKLNSTSADYVYTPPLMSDNTATTLDEEQQTILQLTTESPQHIGTQIEAAILRERHAEAQQITSNMRQIHEINQDLASLVQNQQDTIDVIEEDAFEIHDSAERGFSQLERARAMMKTGYENGNFWRVFFMVMAVGGLMIAIILLLEAL
mmetsp:Transcript_10901/g.15876  ORF Transcript_10901/g.15876 Transcript_10901/m.15876 type:complete len:207 (+) Transcript_10901:211-831(+)